MRQLGFEGETSPHEVAARAFDDKHPHVWALVERYALEAAARGVRRIGIAAVWERIRWHVIVETEPGSRFKLNNSFRAYYARRFQREHPEHRELFEVRRMRSRRWQP